MGQTCDVGMEKRKPVIEQRPFDFEILRRLGMFRGTIA